MTNELGRFNHHDNPAIDFEIEVEELIGMVYNRKIGFATEPTLDTRLFKAMQFRVGGDLGAIKAKAILRELERSVVGY